MRCGAVCSRQSVLSLLLPGCRYVQDYDPNDAKTHKGLDLYRMTMADLYKVCE